jgi:hypothetical protein
MHVTVQFQGILGVILFPVAKDTVLKHFIEPLEEIRQN